MFDDVDSGLYTLDADNQPVRERNVLVWAHWLETSGQRIVAQDVIGERIQVSTVFLGIDHNFGRQGPPILWETMHFWVGEMLEPHHSPLGFTLPNPAIIIDDNQRRYRSRAAALKGHAQGVALATRVLQELDAKKIQK